MIQSADRGDTVHVFRLAPIGLRARTVWVGITTSYCIAMLWLGFGLRRGVLGGTGSPATHAYVVMAVVGAAVVVFMWWWMGRLPEPHAIELHPDHLRLPRSRHAHRFRDVPYDCIYSVARVRPRPFRRLFLGATGIAFPLVIDAAWFTRREALDDLERALLERIGELPDGKSRIAAIERRRAVARSVESRRPVVTLTLIALIAVVGVCERWAPGNDLIRPLRLGANAAWLWPDGGAYRMLTGLLLHASTLHLVLNAVALAVIGRPLEGLIGRARFVVVAFSSAVGGSLGVVLGTLMSVGISSVALGMLGGLYAVALARRDQLPQPYRVPLIGLALLVVFELMIWTSSATAIDEAGHVGGFVAGALATWLTLPGLDLTRSSAPAGLPIRLAATAAVTLAIVAAAQGIRFVARTDGPAMADIVMDRVGRPGVPPEVALLAVAAGPGRREPSADEIGRLAASLAAIAPDAAAVRSREGRKLVLQIRAELAHMLGRPEEALALARDAVAVDPDEPGMVLLALLEKHRLDGLRSQTAPLAPRFDVRIEPELVGPDTRAIALRLGHAREQGFVVDVLAEQDGALTGILRFEAGPGSAADYDPISAGGPIADRVRGARLSVVHVIDRGRGGLMRDGSPVAWWYRAVDATRTLSPVIE